MGRCEKGRAYKELSPAAPLNLTELCIKFQLIAVSRCHKQSYTNILYIMSMNTQLTVHTCCALGGGAATAASNSFQLSHTFSLEYANSVVQIRLKNKWLNFPENANFQVNFSHTVQNHAPTSLTICTPSILKFLIFSTHVSVWLTDFAVLEACLEQDGHIMNTHVVSLLHKYMQPIS